MLQRKISFFRGYFKRKEKAAEKVKSDSALNKAEEKKEIESKKK